MLICLHFQRPYNEGSQILPSVKQEGKGRDIPRSVDLMGKGRVRALTARLTGRYDGEGSPDALSYSERSPTARLTGGVTGRSRRMWS